MELNVNNETKQLRAVLLGIADSFGDTPNLVDCYDPKSREHVLNGTFPQAYDIINELKEFEEVLEKYSVDIFRPENIEDLNQIFSRDIAFVISDKIILSNIIADRKKEILAIDNLLTLVDKENIIKLDKHSRIEGGDVILYNSMIFIGYSEQEDFMKFKVSRTNKNGVESIKCLFPEKKIKSFELVKSDDNAIENSLFIPLKEAREIFEKEYLTTQLKKFNGNISKTADFIGMERSALHRKLKGLGIKELN